MSKKKIEQCEIIIKQKGKCKGDIYLDCLECPKKLYNDCHNKNNHLVFTKSLEFTPRVELAKQYIEKKSKPKERDIPIDMWVARDKDGTLYKHFVKPKKNILCGWGTSYDKVSRLDNLLYPDVKWEDDEPLKIN